jgi:DNA mismatch repair protein MutS
MCGVPYHSAGTYLQRLLRKGYRVALCEQMEDPKATKTIVRREVTRVLTPGTAVDAALDASESQWLASISAPARPRLLLRRWESPRSISPPAISAPPNSPAPSAWALALDELSPHAPAEVVYARGSAGFGSTSQSVRQGVLRETGAEPKEVGEEPAQLDISGARTESKTGPSPRTTPCPAPPAAAACIRSTAWAWPSHAAAVAAGAIVHYLRATKQGALAHLDTLRYYERNDALELDAVSVRNLELVEPLFSSEGPQTTLFWTLDACCTPMGKRLLRAQLLRPMQSLDAINARLDAVAEAVADLRHREGLRRAMDGILDLERLLGRVSLETAGPREVVALGKTLARLPGLRAAVANLSRRIRKAAGQSSPHGLDTLDDLNELIARTLVDEPPVALSDGGAIREGVDADLDDASASFRPMAASALRRSRSASANAPASARSRSGSTPSSATTSKSPRRTRRPSPPTTSASRRWSTPSASPRPS